MFEKTGALTCGVPTVVKPEIHGDYDVRFKMLVLSLLHGINHPVAVAVIEWLTRYHVDENRGDDFKRVEMQEVTIIPGKGVEGTSVDGTKVRAGSPRWLGIEEIESDHTMVCVVISDVHRATFRLKDRMRNTAKPVLQRLRERKITTHLISGDNEGATHSVAFALELSRYTTRHSLLPEQKKEYVESLQKQGKTVMYIGDGIDNGATLAQADVGVHIDPTSFVNVNNNHHKNNVNRSDDARPTADIILTNPSKLHGVLILLDISKAAYRRIVLNFVWSAVYNLSAILFAAGAFGGAKIPVQFAGLGELVSVLPVVLVALQLKVKDFGRRWRKEEYDMLRKVKG